MKTASKVPIAEHTLREGGALDGCNLGRSKTCLRKGGAQSTASRRSGTSDRGERSSVFSRP